MEGITLKDVLMAVTFLSSLAVAVHRVLVKIASVAQDVRWIRKWCTDHQSNDDRRFEDLTSDVSGIRKDVLDIWRQRRD